MERVLIALFSVILLAGGCQKAPAGPAECAQVARAPAAFLAYWYFPRGSYWVYQKRGASPVEVDTVTVIGSRVRVFQPGQTTYGLPTCTELYDYTCWHSNRRYFPGVSPNSGFRGLEFFESQEESGHWFVTQSTENMYDIGFLWSYPQLPVGQPIANTGPTLLDTLPVSVPAGRFARSVHLRIDAVHDSTKGAFVRSYHLTRGIGYTRKVYANLGTWELVKYHLAPPVTALFRLDSAPAPGEALAAGVSILPWLAPVIGAFFMLPADGCKLVEPACELPKPVCKFVKPHGKFVKQGCDFGIHACEFIKPGCEFILRACERPKPGCGFGIPACERALHAGEGILRGGKRALPAFPPNGYLCRPRPYPCWLCFPVFGSRSALPCSPPRCCWYWA
ncbi:hypothetical protein [Hymenobacter armeniacus]|uniref:Lipoprotein n=1 Tax=Hymenobacter armeniacus TaxID=2771358 RepID=A0ABR8JWJ9_9BACT|nr:hypothetical protein [Hymenobacter armeniacus]MBD2722950.1 hypothetical protein [Hymenobacter armeniacus]